jgi:hypothetical protein
VYQGPRIGGLSFPPEVTDSQIKNLDNIAVEFFNNICRQQGRSDGCYKYVDLYGKADRNWPSRRVDVVDISKLAYSVVQSISQPSFILSEDYCNSLSESGSFRFTKTKSVSSTCSWTVTSGIQYQNSISATVGIPELAQTSFSESINMNFASTSSQSTTHVDSWEIDTVVPVPPFTYVNATYAVIEQDFDCTWTAEIKIRGCANVWFNDKVNGHWEWWYMVSEIYSTLPGFTCWDEPESEGGDVCDRSFCFYQSAGRYYGIGGASAHLNTDSDSCKKQELFLQY